MKKVLLILPMIFFSSLSLMSMDALLKGKSDESLQCDCITERMLHRRECSFCISLLQCPADLGIEQKYQILRAEIARIKNSSKDQRKIDERDNDIKPQ